MANLIDLTGMVFGRLTVLEKRPSVKSSTGQFLTYWKCRCACGKVVEIHSNSIRRGLSKSCGCFYAERIKVINVKHGMTRTKEYRAWAHAKGRCHRPSDPRYRIYGARGIKMCDRWKNSFQSFLEAMGRAPSKQHTLERKDSGGNYEPSNCIWATYAEQANNKSTNRIMDYNGKRMTLAQLAHFVGREYHSLHAQLSRRDSLESAIAHANPA